ncbi:O-antigen ligase family protein [Limosilactobacillus mucosae]|uniref:O-antigen ligase-related domain-containing protein n=2 Tax=Limosilactobacillus mucosae TaxID=97478 RepID=A0A0R1PCM4_LIMMU|nr:O-antigen ligase family protein [Limosilactobacillus mucosae]KRL26056.1 hypothetical protein FC47_GL001834 [Limosilactobacillus mucosae DSM 13345]QOL70348.1 O-antigen ligase family protein [Limosilactobacillus mucosae]
MIFGVISLIIILYSFFNYKNAFFAFLLYKIILVQNISFISIPGVPLLTADTVLSMWFCIYYFLGGKKYKRTSVEMPYKVPLLIFCVVWFLSSVFSVDGFGSEITRYIQNVLDNVIMIFLIWNLVETKEDFKVLFKGITLIMFITCIYGFVEFLLQSNPLQQYEATLVQDPEKVIDYSYETENRGYRISSVFSHSIGAGLTWALYFITIVILKVKRNKKLPWQFFSTVTAILCFLCVFLTKMRSPLVFMGLSLLSVVDFRKKRFYYFLISALLIGICLVPLVQNNTLVVLKSLFNQSAAAQIQGSSLQQRIGQFQSGFQLLKYNPLVGLGDKFQSTVTDITQVALTQQLLGMESVWLSTMVEYGILGICAEFIWIGYFLIKIPRLYRSLDVFFVALSYVITISITSTPGFQIYLLYLSIFYLLKSTDFYRNGSLK